jgi:YVTN family beta-propeller protein
LTIVATVSVGRAPFAMALSPDAKRLYVGNVQGGTVSVINTATFAVIDVLQSGAMPYGAAVVDDGSRVLITNQQAGTVVVLATQGVPPAQVKVGAYPEGIGIVADGARCYVANWFSDDVSVIDLATLKEVRRVKVPGGPRAIAVVHQNLENRAP